MKKLILLMISVCLTLSAQAQNKVSHEGVLLDNIQNAIEPLQTIKQSFTDNQWEILAQSDDSISAKRHHKNLRSELTLSLKHHSITYACKCYKTKLVRQNGKRVELVLESFPKKSFNKLKKSIRQQMRYKQEGKLSYAKPAKESGSDEAESSENTIKRRLTKLKDLHDNELITEEEYKNKRQQILDEL